MEPLASLARNSKFAAISFSLCWPKQRGMKCWCLFHYYEILPLTLICFLRSQKQHNGCDNGIPDDFIFKEARKIPRHFTYTHNAKCLGTNIDGTLSLMNVNDKRCRYRLFKWT